MREPKAEWVSALRACTGVETDTIRFNDQLGRWEVVMAGADGVPRSQFWAWFVNPLTGERIEPDPVTGLCPFRELDDAGMAEMLRNLERTFVGNRWDGAGSPRKEILRRKRFNDAMREQRYREVGSGFADVTAERGRQLRGSPLIHVPCVLGGRGTPEQEAVCVS